MKTKTCTTCKFEPEWDDFQDGECKKLPEFIKLVFSEYQTFGEPEIKVSGFRNNHIGIVKDCSLWEAKE